jgi:hypothetical protein
VEFLGLGERWVKSDVAGNVVAAFGTIAAAIAQSVPNEAEDIPKPHQKRSAPSKEAVTSCGVLPRSILDVAFNRVFEKDFDLVKGLSMHGDIKIEAYGLPITCAYTAAGKTKQAVGNHVTIPGLGHTLSRSAAIIQSPQHML